MILSYIQGGIDDMKNNMKVYTVKEVCEILKLSPQTIRKYTKTGALKAIDKPGKILIPETSLKAYLGGE